MPDHPPEEDIRHGEEKAKKADPHGLGQPRQQGERAEGAPKAQPTDDRHATENAGKE